MDIPSAAGVLRFPGGALAVHSDDEPEWIGVCRGAPEDHEDQELWQSIDEKVWKLMERVQNKWGRLRDCELLADVVEGVKFKDGERVEDHSQGTTETAVYHI